MSNMNHTCIKPACENKYDSEDVEAYYCPSCAEANKALAKQIDAQVAARPKRNRVSAIQEYEANRNMSAGGMKGMHVKI